MASGQAHEIVQGRVPGPLSHQLSLPEECVPSQQSLREGSPGSLGEIPSRGARVGLGNDEERRMFTGCRRRQLG